MSVIFYADRLVRQEWNGKTKSYEEFPVRVQDLRSVVSVEPGVTLGQIFALVAAHEEIKIAVAEYAWCGWIDEFHDAALLPREEEKGDAKLVKLVVSAYGELNDWGGKTEFQLSTNFGAEDATGDHWGISYSPMQTIAHLPVVIDEEFVVRRWVKDEELRIVEVFRATRSFTLLEFLDAIYFDISFHGGPKDNAAFLEELGQCINEIESGEVKTIPFEDVMRDLEKET